MVRFLLHFLQAMVVVDYFQLHNVQMILTYYTPHIVFSKCINISFTNRILYITTVVTHNFKIEDRRRKVATLLAQSMTETEIAQKLKVDQSTIKSSIGYPRHN